MSGTFLLSRGSETFVVDASATTVDPTDEAIIVANNLRIASLTIATYDYLITLPAEIRLCKDSSRRSVGFVLFLLLRYTSILLLFVSNFGFFYHHFTPAACVHYFYLSPILKVIQLMVSQAILGIRTYNIAQRNILIGRIIAWAYFFSSVFLWFTALFNRQPEMTNGNCMIGSSHPEHTISAWSFYLVAMLYDFLVLFLSTHQLLRLKQASPSSTTGRLLSILLTDGLGYFIVLTVVNCVNVVLYRGVGGAIQSSGASMEYAVIWIMSQRVLIHLRELRARQASHILSQVPRATMVMSSPPHTHRPPFKPGSGSGSNENVTDIGNKYDTAQSNFCLGVHVERSIIKDVKQPDGGVNAERDLFAPPKSSFWDETQESTV